MKFFCDASTLQYEDAKAVIKIEDADGKPKHEFTTWRGDFIEEMLKGTQCAQGVAAGDKISIEIEVKKISNE